jgi:6-phosphogluconate dehydrogenase
MELAMVGLGRMGGGMARRLIAGGHKVVVYDPVRAAMEALVKAGARSAPSLADLVKSLKPSRIIWLMVPAGPPTERTIKDLARELTPGDLIVDGGNSNYKDSMRRARWLSARKINFLDVGTSGGIWGLKEGYCLMVGGDEAAFKRVKPVLETLAPSHSAGYAYMGKSGSGHFVKMVHNGIEYGMMEAYAEGFELMSARRDLHLDLAKIAEVWNRGSIIRSWLLELAARALKDNPKLEGMESYVDDSGEGRWTVQESVDLGVPLPVITLSLQARFRSRQSRPFGGKILAALRGQFGGHAVRKKRLGGPSGADRG